MFFFLSKLLDVFLSPYTWAVFLLAVALPWRRPRRFGSSARRRWRTRRAAGLIGLLVLVAFGMGPVSNAILYRLEHATVSSYRRDVVYDAVVLLGGMTDDHVRAEIGQSAYNENVDRVIAAHRVAAEGRARFVIVSSAPADPKLVEIGEARQLAQQIERWGGVAASRIIIEEQARNTHENAVYTERIVRAHRFEKVLVITSAFHMQRAKECFNAVGLEVDTLAVDYRAHERANEWLPRAGALSESTLALHEWAGLYIYRWRGYAKPSA